MKMYVGVTDYDWYTILKESNCEEVNFWRPSGNVNFRAIAPGEMFLFKLHSPRNYIVGGGFLARYYKLPTFLVWDALGIENGTRSLSELNTRVTKYNKRKGIDNLHMDIGCIILTQPFFFEEKDWIPIPEDWNPNIVSGKTYDTSQLIGRRLYDQVTERLNKKNVYDNNLIIAESNEPRYGRQQIITPRLGQGSFRIVVTEAYHRKCSISGEKTLPVLDAAHIRPFSEDGPNLSQNGILLRTDIHTLYDKGYITIDEDYRIEVSKRLNQDFGNGKMYYDYHGKKLLNVPDNKLDMPSKEFLRWHNENIYLG